MPDGNSARKDGQQPNCVARSAGELDHPVHNDGSAHDWKARWQEPTRRRVPWIDQPEPLSWRAGRLARARRLRYRLISSASQTAPWDTFAASANAPVHHGHVWKIRVLRIWVWGGKSWVGMPAETAKVVGGIALTQTCRNDEDLGRLLRGPRAYPWLTCVRGSLPQAYSFRVPDRGSVNPTPLGGMGPPRARCTLGHGEVQTRQPYGLGLQVPHCMGYQISVPVHSSEPVRITCSAAPERAELS
jgi:hypothetical protein